MTEYFEDTERLVRLLMYLGGTLLGVLIVSILVVVTSGVFFRRLARSPRLGKVAEFLLRIHRSIRRFVILMPCSLCWGSSEDQLG